MKTNILKSIKREKDKILSAPEKRMDDDGELIQGEVIGYIKGY